MIEKAPVEVGERFVSMRTGKEVVVINTMHLSGTSSGWNAQVETRPGWCKWMTCSKDGIRGYRRKP